MKRSTHALDERPLPRASLAGLVSLEVTARLAAPAAVLGAVHGMTRGAMLAAATVSGLAVLRALLAGHCTEQVLRATWRGLARATRAMSIAAIHRRADSEGVAALMDAAAASANFETRVLPRLLASGLGLLLICGVVAWRLGLAWLLAGAVAVGCAGLLALWPQRRMLAVQRQSFARFASAAHQLEVLLLAAVELRAHDKEAHASDALLALVDDMAHAERRVATLAALLGLFPFGIALLILLAPLSSLLPSLTARLGGANVLEVTILGGTAAMFAWGVMNALEGWVRSAPHRAALRGFVDQPRRDEPTPKGDEVSLRDASIAIEGLSVVHPGARLATPAAVTLSWPPGRALALTGPNGSGKTTLAMCLLGLIEPSAGSISVDGRPAGSLDWSEIRGRVVFVPQHAFIADDRSVAWHLRLLSHGEPSDAQLEAAIEAVGLTDVLAQHASGEPAIDTLASELSGGERQRMHLARALLGDPELIVLDEPEAMIDGEGRVWLHGLLERLSKRARLVVIVHDSSVLPEHAHVVVCRADTP